MASLEQARPPAKEANSHLREHSSKSQRSHRHQYGLEELTDLSRKDNVQSAGRTKASFSGQTTAADLPRAQGIRQAASTLDVFSLEDTGGLPLEIWRLVFVFLPVCSLCRCSQVCKSWRHLVISLDGTTWQAHFNRNREWRQPSWPTSRNYGPRKSWQTLYKEHFLCARIWALGNKEPTKAQCLHVFRKRRERKIIRVGPDQEHTTLKSALGIASEYDRILLAPGLYDEQFEMCSKIPFELVGDGELGSVVLLTCIEQNALTARLCNLVIRAPWFTSHVLKIVTGHLQVDTCVLEDGQVSIINPGTAHFRYCSFVRTQVHCVHLRLSFIENCDFSECEACALVVEGAPKTEANWAQKYLLHCADTYQIRHRRWAPLEVQQSCHEECSVAELDLEGSSLTLNQTGFSMADGQLSASSKAYLVPANSSIGITDTTSQVDSDTSTDTGEWDTESCYSGRSPLTPRLYSSGREQQAGPSWLIDDTSQPPLWASDTGPKLSELLRQDTELEEQLTTIVGCILRRCRISNGQGGITVTNQGALRIEQSELCDLQYGIRCLQNAKITVLENSIHRCNSSGLFLRLGATGIVAANDIHSTREAGIDIRKQADPLIQYNRIHHSKRSGVVVLGAGRGTIKANDIYQNREAGIYILYKGDPYIRDNRIHHGQAAGIAVTEYGRGYIGNNLISGNRWGGIDVRRGADPRVSHNLVCTGLADGIVIGTQGRGTIDANVVRGNLGCGIWVMSGRPSIQGNKIYNNKASGIVLVYKELDDRLSADESASESEAGLDGASSATFGLPETTPSESSVLPAIAHQIILKYNSVYHNAGNGLLAKGNETLFVFGNGFHSNRNTGVHIRQIACVTFTSNSVTCNAGPGVQVAPQAKARLEGNGVYDNTGHGVLIAGEATLINNDIFYNQQSAVNAESGSTIEIRTNRLYSLYDAAIMLEKDVSGSVTDNALYEGRATPSIQYPEHTTCRVTANNLMAAKRDDNLRLGVDWFLDDPPPRPHIEAPPPTSVPSTPARRVTSAGTVLTPAGGSGQEGSKLCIIL